MDNDWRKYTQEDDSDEEQDPRKVLDEDFDFLAKHWPMYLVVLCMGLGVIAVYVLILISIISLFMGGHW